MNSVCEELCEGDPHADSTAVSVVTQDDHWIMMLEREAPQADLSKETGFEGVRSHVAHSKWTGSGIAWTM